MHFAPDILICEGCCKKCWEEVGKFVNNLPFEGEYMVVLAYTLVLLHLDRLSCVKNW